VTGIDAFGIEPSQVVVSRFEVPVPGLPPALDGLRIAHLSYVHLPGNVPAAEIALSHLRRERPEIVVMTGDITERAAALPQVEAFARAARGSLATVATLGNWEYHGGAAPGAAAAYRAAGAELLVNAHRVVQVGQESVHLVGLDDPVMGEPDLLSARASLETGGVEIWLVHAPGIVKRLPSFGSANPALVLAGHTHGGQIRLPLVPALTPQGSGRFVAGWYRENSGPLYVSRGIGTTTIPARLRCPPELPIFTLRTASAAPRG